MDIAGKTALITGGASGLGRGTAELLSARGARVVLLDLPSSDVDAVAAGLGGVAVKGDVTSEADAERAVAAAVEAGGGLHVLVNCAGIGPSQRIVGREGPMPLEAFKRVVNVNLFGTFNLMRVAAFQMASQGPAGDDKGVIINTASVAAFEGQVGQIAYSASKGGIVAMTICAARDLASHRIRVMTIAPGIMETPLLGTLSEEFRESLAASVPHPHRLGTPQDYAQLALAIVENGLLNGETIRLDGAIRMAPR